MSDTGRVLYGPTGRALYNPANGRALYSGVVDSFPPSQATVTWNGYVKYREPPYDDVSADLFVAPTTLLMDEFLSSFLSDGIRSDTSEEYAILLKDALPAQTLPGYYTLTFLRIYPSSIYYPSSSSTVIFFVRPVEDGIEGGYTFHKFFVAPELHTNYMTDVTVTL